MATCLSELGSHAAALALLQPLLEETLGQRFSDALCCAAGVIAVAFLALERTQPGYLEGFGL